MTLRRIATLALLALVSALLPGGTLAQEPSMGGPVHSVAGNLLRETLPNGLEVLILEDHSAPVVAARVYVRTGSLYEDRYLGCGISHLYEHLLAGGTTSTRTQEEADILLQSIGGQSNAYTTYDVTCYHITTSTEYYRTAVDLLADWMQHNILDPGEVDRERVVVQRELAMNDTEPESVLWRIFQETMFRHHPIRLPVIGYQENIQRLTRDDIERFYRERYAPNNAVVAIAGDVSRAEALDAVRAAFGSWERRPLPEFMLPEEPRQTAARWVEETLGAAQSTMGRVGYHAVDLLHPDLYPLDILSFILTNGESSRLVRDLVIEQRLCDSLGSFSWTPWFGAGQFVFAFDTDDPAKVQPILDGIEAHLRAIQETPPSPEELARAKQQKISEHVFGAQDMESRAERIANDLIATGDPLFSELYVREIQRVTPEDVQRVARTYFAPENRTVAILRPEGTPPARPEGAEGASTAATGVRLETLPNGLKVLLRETPGSGDVAVQAYLRGGVRFEAPAAGGSLPPNGTFSVLSRMLVRGTETRSADEISSIIEGMGGSIGPDSGSNSFGLGMSLLAGDLARGLDIFADCLLHPAFPEDGLALEKQRGLYMLRNIQADWQSEGIFKLREVFFGDHPYGMNPYGTRENIQRLDRNGLRDVHRRFVRADNLVLSIFGDIDSNAALDLVRERFGRMEGGFREQPSSRAARAIGQDETRVFPSDKEQVTILVGFPGLSVEAPERAALAIIDGITSGVSLPSGWLQDALRGGDRSLVYFVHAIPFPGLGTGMFYVLTQCAPENEEEVTRLVLEQMERMRRGEFTEEEFENARRQNLVDIALEHQTNAQQADSAALNELFGLGANYDQRFRALLQQATPDDVRRLAARLLQHHVLVVLRPGP